MKKIWIFLPLLTLSYLPTGFANPSNLIGSQLALFATLSFSSDRCAEPKCCQAKCDGSDYETCSNGDCD